MTLVKGHKVAAAGPVWKTLMYNLVFCKVSVWVITLTLCLYLLSMIAVLTHVL